MYICIWHLPGFVMNVVLESYELTCDVQKVQDDMFTRRTIACLYERCCIPKIRKNPTVLVPRESSYPNLNLCNTNYNTVLHPRTKNTIKTEPKYKTRKRGSHNFFQSIYRAFHQYCISRTIFTVISLQILLSRSNAHIQLRMRS